MRSWIVLSLLCSAVRGQYEADAEVLVEEGLQYLLAGRDGDGGWGADTAKAVLAVALVNDSALVGLERTLTLKELEINLLADLWRHRDFPVTTARLAEYVLAMVSLCADVRDFQGRDLTAVLQHSHAGPEYESAYAVLASCVARAPVRRRSYERLLTVTDTRPDLHGTDTLALSVLALRCVADHSSQHVEKHLQTPLMALIERQAADGGFGNMFSTLLAIQALRMELVSGWNESAAMAYVLRRRQHASAALGSLFDTAGALPVLAGRTLLDAAGTDCHRTRPSVSTDASTAAVSPTYEQTSSAAAPGRPAGEGERTGHAGEGAKSDEDDGDGGDDAAAADPERQKSPAPPTGETATTTEVLPVTTPVLPPIERPANLSLQVVTLWLWIGAAVDEQHSIRLEVPADTNMFECMQLAAERDQHFRFSAEVWPNGHYIHTIDGHSERKDGFQFWMLYSLSEPPDVQRRPAASHVHKTGVDTLFPTDGSHVLFWYKEL